MIYPTAARPGAARPGANTIAAATLTVSGPPHLAVLCPGAGDWFASLDDDPRGAR